MEMYKGGAKVHLLRSMGKQCRVLPMRSGGAIRGSSRGLQWCQLPH